MRGVKIVVAIVIAIAPLACATEDPTVLRSGGGLKRRTNNAPAVKASKQVPATATEQEKCVDIINQYRATKGLSALTRWTDKEDCSDGEAESDSKSGKAHGAFTQCTEMAQNECPSYPGPVSDNLPECLADMWAEGPGGGHYDNMTSKKYTKVACGIYELSDGDFWSVQNFR
ncbi:MAG: CAP domain-containing protein [Labilithrix sp.]